MYILFGIVVAFIVAVVIARGSDRPKDEEERMYAALAVGLAGTFWPIAVMLAFLYYFYKAVERLFGKKE